MGALIVRPHLLSARDEIRLARSEGASVAEMLADVWDESLDDHIVATLDGEYIPRDQWALVPPAGSVVRATIVYHGGGGNNKSILAAVAMIAIAVFAPYAATAWFGAVQGTWQAAAIAAGITFVGSLAVSAIFKPSNLQPGGASNDPASSDVYRISGQSNQLTPYGIVPRSYGRNKIFPRIAGTPFVENVGDNQYLYMLLDFGYGYLAIEELCIGDTPIGNFRGVDYRIWPNFVAGNALQIYTADQSYQQIGTTLGYVVTESRTSAVQTNRITLDFVWTEGLVQYRDDGSQTAVTSQLKIELADVNTGVRVPYGNFPFSFSSSLVSAVNPVLEQGTLTLRADRLVPGMNRSSWGFAIGQTVFNASPGQNVQIGNQIRFQDGQQRTIIGLGPNNTPITIDQGLQFNISVSQTSAVWTNVTRFYSSSASASLIYVTGTETRAVYLSVSITVPQGQYAIYVTRVSADAPDDKTRNTVVWQGVRSSTFRAPIAPKTPRTIMELKIQATGQLQGQIQNLSAVCTRLLTDTNGNATWERNPAYAFYEVLSSGVPQNKIDKASIEHWASVCRDTTRYGETAFLFDHVIDYSSTVYQILAMIAAAARASVAFHDGLIGVIVDQEQTIPVQLFTPRNSRNFSASRSYLQDTQAFQVKFIDPATSWGEGVVTVYGEGWNADTATQFEELRLIGVTRPSQAWRDGRYFMAQALLRRETFTVDIDVEALVCLRGDLVLVQHDVLEVGGDSSRINTVISPTVFTQMDPLPLMAGSIGVRIRHGDGSITAPIPATASPPYTWTLTTADPAMQAGDLLVWGTLGIETGEYLVKDITPAADLTATLTLIEMARAVYDSDTGTIPPYTPPANGRPPGLGPQPVTNPVLIQLNSTIGRGPFAEIDLQWQPGGTGNYYKFRIYQAQSNNTLVLIADSLASKYTFAASLDLINSPLVNVPLTFAIEAVDYTGNTSPLTYFSATISNPMWVPGDVPFLATNVNGSETVLTWRDPDPVPFGQGNEQIVAYDIRWSVDVNADYEQSSRVAELVTFDTHKIAVPSRNGVYLIKAVTSSGMYSAHAAKSVTATAALVLRDWYDQIEFGPAWDGLANGVEVVNRSLRLTQYDDGTYRQRGYWVARAKERFNDVLQCRVTTSIAAYGLLDTATLASAWFTPLANAVPLQPYGLHEYDAKVWVASSEIFTTVMADWVPLASAVPLAGMPVNIEDLARPIIAGEIIGKELYFIVELRSMNPNVTPVVTEAGVYVDFPERLETHDDIAIPAGGHRLVFDWPFVFPPNIGYALQNAQPGDMATFTNIDQYGVDLIVWNASHASIAGTLDIQAWGVGRLP